MMVRNICTPIEETSLVASVEQLQFDLKILEEIRRTRYLLGRSNKIPKCGNLHLAFEYAKEPDNHHLFTQILRVSPYIFEVLHQLIKDHPVFQNNSHSAQAPVNLQLAVTLYQMGRYGNAATVQDIAQDAGISKGSVELYTKHCFEAIESLHDMFVCPLTEEEKEREKQWIDEQVGLRGSLWREGWIMYDGTIVVLFSKPGMNGNAYYTRKGNYGLNIQASAMCDYIF